MYYIITFCCIINHFILSFFHKVISDNFYKKNHIFEYNHTKFSKVVTIVNFKENCADLKINFKR